MATQPPLVSPDGRFYWNGERWVALESQPQTSSSDTLRQAQEWSAPRWSPDGQFWWDGYRWVPVGAVPTNVPAHEWKPSPGLRRFLIAALIATDVVTGFFALFGLLALAQYLGLLGATQDRATQDSSTPEAIGLIVFFVFLFALSLAATVGVARRSAWARVVAIGAGVAVSLTCLGLVLGIPILVSASRASLKKEVK